MRTNNGEEITCDRDGKVYNPYLGDRFWSGEWTEVVDGEEVTYRTLCDSCHRDLVRT